MGLWLCSDRVSLEGNSELVRIQLLPSFLRQYLAPGHCCLCYLYNISQKQFLKNTLSSPKSPHATPKHSRRKPHLLSICLSEVSQPPTYTLLKCNQNVNTMYFKSLPTFHLGSVLPAAALVLQQEGVWFSLYEVSQAPIKTKRYQWSCHFLNNGIIFLKEQKSSVDMFLFRFLFLGP